METGQLALFSVGERFGENLIVGRWFPDVDGDDWIYQPGRRIRVAKDIILWIVGRIVPLEARACEWSIRSGLLVTGGLTFFETLLPFVE